MHYAALYYTPKLTELAGEVTRKCETCLLTKAPRTEFGSMGQIGPASRPFEIIHIDTVGGLSGYHSKKKYLHLAIDAFTRFVWATTPSTQVTNDFINLVQTVSKVDTPKLVVADRYTGIRSKEFQHFLSDRKIKLTFTPTDHPQSNGLVERVNQTSINRLRAFRLERPTTKQSWAVMMTQVIAEYNNTIHSVTRFPPLYLLVGKDPDGLYQGQCLEENRKKAFEYSQAQHSYDKERYDGKHSNPEFKKGEEIYVQNKNDISRRKLDPYYTGPYPVVEKTSDNTVKVKKGDKTELVHVSKVKPAVNVRRPMVFHNKLYPIPILILSMISLLTFSFPAKAMQMSNSSVDPSPYSKDLLLHLASNYSEPITISIFPVYLKKTKDVIQTGTNYTTFAMSLLSGCEYVPKASRDKCEELFDSLFLYRVHRLCRNTSMIRLLPSRYGRSGLPNQYHSLGKSSGHSFPSFEEAWKKAQDREVEKHARREKNNEIIQPIEQAGSVRASQAIRVQKVLTTTTTTRSPLWFFTTRDSRWYLTTRTPRIVMTRAPPIITTTTRGPRATTTTTVVTTYVQICPFDLASVTTHALCTRRTIHDTPPPHQKPDMTSKRPRQGFNANSPFSI